MKKNDMPVEKTEVCAERKQILKITVAAVSFNGQKVAGFNNIELITDRPLEVNLKEIYETKKRFPNHAIIASIMVEPKAEKWHEIVKKLQDVGIDVYELNFGCPHGMAERGMGSASGQVPELVEKQTYWAKGVIVSRIIQIEVII